MSARTLAALALLALALVQTHAQAEERHVLLVHAGAGDPVTRHLVDELVPLGVTLEISPATERDLAELGRARGARAVLRVAASKRAIDIWVNSAPETIHVEEQRGEEGDSAALSLRAVELLRGRLLPMESSGPDPISDGQPPPPRTSPPVARSAPPPPGPLIPPLRLPERPRPAPPVHGPARPFRLSLRLAPAALVHPRGDGISAAGTLVAGARWMFAGRLGGDLVALVPVLPTTIASSEGRVQLAAGVLGLGAWLDVLDPASPVGMGLGAGLGAGFLSYYGQPQTARVEGRDGSVPYALPFARWGLVWRALPGFGVCLEALGAVVTPRPVLRLPGRSTDAYFGQPLLAFGVGLEVAIR